MSAPPPPVSTCQSCDENPHPQKPPHCGRGKDGGGGNRSLSRAPPPAPLHGRGGGSEPRAHLREFGVRDVASATGGVGRRGAGARGRVDGGGASRQRTPWRRSLHHRRGWVWQRRRRRHQAVGPAMTLGRMEVKAEGRIANELVTGGWQTPRRRRRRVGWEQRRKRRWQPSCQTGSGDGGAAAGGSGGAGVG